MNPPPSNNGAFGDRARELDPQAPKTKTDEKMARHFNGIVFAILLVLALGVLIAIWIFHHQKQKIVPHSTQKQTVRNHDGPKFNTTSEHGLESSHAQGSHA